MEKRKRNKVIVRTFGDGDSHHRFCQAVTGRAQKEEDAETITVYLWSTNLYEKYAPYIQEQLPDIKC